MSTSKLYFFTLWGNFLLYTIDYLADDEHDEPTTLAAHFDGEEYTESELDEIRQFAEFVKNKRAK